MARPTRPRNINRYSPEFKLKAVKLTQIEGVQVKDVAEALDIHPYMLSKWRTDVREGRIKARVAVAQPARRRPKPSAKRTAKVVVAPADKRAMRQLAALKREHALLKEEHALLKKAIRFSSQRRLSASRSSTKRRTGSG